MLVAGKPYIQSAWASFKKHNANMDTLVALGTLVAYFYSLVALFAGLLFTSKVLDLSSFRSFGSSF